MRWFLASFLVLALGGAAYAAEPYVVTGVQVDVTADTAAHARNQAIKDASRKAFETLAGQLQPDKPVPKVSDKALGNMVSDFHVVQEQSSANRYAATFTFRFRQNQVRAAFGNHALLGPHELADHIKNPDAPMTPTTGDDASIQQIIADETRDPAQQPSSAAQDISMSPDAGQSILVQVTANNGRELDEAKHRFSTLAAVREIEYVSITPTASILRVSYSGDVGKLISLMHSHGVSLRRDADTDPPLYVLEP